MASLAGYVFCAFANREDRAAPVLSPLEVSPQPQATKGKLPVTFVLLGGGRGD